jgi:hypothetical protein
MSSPLLSALPLLFQVVHLTPGEAVVPLGAGEHAFEVLVRNIGESELQDLRLEAAAEGCTVVVSPASIAAVGPSDRVTYTVTARATPELTRRRVPLRLSLSSRNRGPLTAVEVLVDGRRTRPRQEGWFDVGVVHVSSRAPAARVLLLTLLSLVPVTGLLLLGWWLKRRAREAPKPGGLPTDPPPGGSPPLP